MAVYLLLGLVVVLVLLIFLQYYKRRWPIHNFPPGPTGLPVIGTLLATGINKEFRWTAANLAERYGNVFSLMTVKHSVLVNGFEAINEAMSANRGCDFASRERPSYEEELTNPKLLGLFSADFSDRWQKQRRFVITTLRGFGFDKTSFAAKIMEEVETLIGELKRLQDTPQNLCGLLSVGVSNIICNIIFGKCYEYNDKELQHILHIFDKWLTHGPASYKMLLIRLLPVTRLFVTQPAQEMRELYAEIDTFIVNKIVEHRKQFKAEDRPYDFIHCYLGKMTDDPELFTLEDLRYILRDLFEASTDTVLQTLRFGLLYMVLNPNIQEKVHEESMKVVGPFRLPCMEDRDRMSYTVATICEIQRLASVAAFIPRSATVDTTLAGYSIPKGTTIECNMWGLHHDPHIWPDPERFDPGRHLNNKGEFVDNPHLLPFGAGRRVCIGKSLAKMELFLVFSSLLHRFKFELPHGTKAPSPEPVPGLVYSPQPYQVVLKEYT